MPHNQPINLFLDNNFLPLLRKHILPVTMPWPFRLIPCITPLTINMPPMLGTDIPLASNEFRLANRADSMLLTRNLANMHPHTIDDCIGPHASPLLFVTTGFAHIQFLTVWETDMLTSIGRATPINLMVSSTGISKSSSIREKTIRCPPFHRLLAMRHMSDADDWAFPDTSFEVVPTLIAQEQRPFRLANKGPST